MNNVSLREKCLALKKIYPNWGSRKIAHALGCSRNGAKYHLDSSNRKASLNRTKARRSHLVLLRRIDSFSRKAVRGKAADFQRRVGSSLGPHKKVFSYSDVVEKLGSKPMCYLTGRPIDLSQVKTYHFDHILPPGKGGDNSLANLGLACKSANIAKGDLTVNEFVQLCTEVLVHQGYRVEKVAAGVGFAPTQV